MPKINGYPSLADCLNNAREVTKAELTTHSKECVVATSCYIENTLVAHRSAMAKKAGSAGRGAAKRRGDTEYYKILNERKKEKNG